jgi:hypothetical protein
MNEKKGYEPKTNWKVGRKATKLILDALTQSVYLFITKSKM